MEFCELLDGVWLLVALLWANKPTAQPTTIAIDAPQTFRIIQCLLEFTSGGVAMPAPAATRWKPRNAAIFCG